MHQKECKDSFCPPWVIFRCRLAEAWSWSLLTFWSWWKLEVKANLSLGISILVLIDVLIWGASICVTQSTLLHENIQWWIYPKLWYHTTSFLSMKNDEMYMKRSRCIHLHQWKWFHLSFRMTIFYEFSILCT